MINNLNDVIQNINDLLELKKEKLRQLYETEKILKEEIVDLEQAKVRLTNNEIHLITDNTKVIKEKSKNIKSKDILEFIRTNGPVSAEDIRLHFNCKSRNIMGLGWLLHENKIVKDGISNKGKDKYSINTELKNGTN